MIMTITLDLDMTVRVAIDGLKDLTVTHALAATHRTGTEWRTVCACGWTTPWATDAATAHHALRNHVTES